MKLNLIEELEARSGGIKVSDLAAILGVDDKHIYRMAARGQLPSFRVGGAVDSILKRSRSGSGPNTAKRTGLRGSRRVLPHLRRTGLPLWHRSYVAWTYPMPNSLRRH